MLSFTAALLLHRGPQVARAPHLPSAAWAGSPVRLDLMMELFDNSVDQFDRLRAAVGFATVEAAICGRVYRERGQYRTCCCT